jgi:mannose-6-phosphate isomerase-like protein (cupin superfamily)
MGKLRGGMVAMRWLLQGGVICLVAGAVAVAQVKPDNALAKSRVFRYSEMPARTMSNGSESRVLARGVLATGEAVALHESVHPVGAAPSPLHPIQHSEIVVVIEGTVEFDHDGTSERVGPGDEMYVALGTQHRMKNVGDGPAKYLVVAVGGDVKK